MYLNQDLDLDQEVGHKLSQKEVNLNNGLIITKIKRIQKKNRINTKENIIKVLKDNFEF